MATFKTTKTRFPQKWADGLTSYNEINVRSIDIISRYQDSILNDNFHQIEYYTEKQVKYFGGEATYVWTKCHLSAQAVSDIIRELLPCVEHYAIITHDKDVDYTTKKPVTPHTHVLIKFIRNERVASRLVEYLHIDGWSDVMYRLSNVTSYLIHDSSECRKKHKYQYSWDDVISDDLGYFKDFICSDPLSNDNTLNILDDIIGKKSMRELATKYGRDVVIHYKHYADFAHKMELEENDELKIYRDNYCLEYFNSDFVAFYDNDTGEIIKVKRVRELPELKEVNCSDEDSI